MPIRECKLFLALCELHFVLLSDATFSSLPACQPHVLTDQYSVKDLKDASAYLRSFLSLSPSHSPFSLSVSISSSLPHKFWLPWSPRALAYGFSHQGDLWALFILLPLLHGVWLSGCKLDNHKAHLVYLPV